MSPYAWQSLNIRKSCFPKAAPSVEGQSRCALCLEFEQFCGMLTDLNVTSVVMTIRLLGAPYCRLVCVFVPGVAYDQCQWVFLGNTSCMYQTIGYNVCRRLSEHCHRWRPQGTVVATLGLDTPASMDRSDQSALLKGGVEVRPTRLDFLTHTLRTTSTCISAPVCVTTCSLSGLFCVIDCSESMRKAKRRL